MKANLPLNEPARLDHWRETNLYEQIRTSREGREKYILHDGPPYANGPIHLGHALNKCIKDMVVKSKTMAGYDSPYVPGWDCHGLPIEIKVDEQLGRKKLEMPPIAVRRACREYAQKFVELQSAQFQRLGVFGRFDRPYSTMTSSYEAKIVESFFAFYEKDFVYKGLRPVYWCIHDRTALAEAEVEYAMHTSPSVYVRYKMLSDPGMLGIVADQPVYTIIWTTTPWTLPASLAVAFNPKLNYVALDCLGGIYIVAADRMIETIAACDLRSRTLPDHPASANEIRATFPGSRLDRFNFQHPFLDRSILGVLADYVTTDQGTGVVHTAPAHGADDFYTGGSYGLSQICHVDNAGRIHDGLPEYEGLTVFKANEPIIELLRSRGALMAREDIHHSYPHCWRCHNPVIFRATEQWFIGMETPMPAKYEAPALPATGNDVPIETVTTYRQRALDEIKRVQWDPSWGEERISNMIATRPDWCISRQRIWGVPIAVFLCAKCERPLKDAAIHQRVVEMFQREGADSWYIHTPAEILPLGIKCGTSGCDSTEFTKEMDILDVWFESGVSWAAVTEVEPELRFPADLYVEGNDQYRGWFHSSLLTAVALRNQSPYKTSATAGWTLDEKGRALSKSLGNYIYPTEVAEQLGGDIIRLWVASVDFRQDVVASVPLMKRLADEIYRPLRNTFRYLLSNLDNFSPVEDAVPFDDLFPFDKYILARAAELTTKVRGYYDTFEFHRVYQALNEFSTVDLSATYLDLIKDRLYTFAPKSQGRRSAQTALWHLAEALVRLVAPILSFTADEVWGYLPKLGNRETSVHIAHFPTAAELFPGDSEQLLYDFWSLLRVRGNVLLALEELRKAKTIGKSLDAKVTLVAKQGYFGKILTKYAAALKELLNISRVETRVELVEVNREWEEHEFESGPISDEAFRWAVDITVSLADGIKCERCWNYSIHVGEDQRWPTVCERCSAALSEMGIEAFA